MFIINQNKSFKRLYILLLMLSLTGCVADSEQVKGRPFELSSLAKTDIDLVTETHQQVVFATLKQLAIKLYKRNPGEWKKAGHESIGAAVSALSSDPFPSVEGKSGVDCIRLAFDEEFRGDRVRAFVVGLETMLLEAYGGHKAFYIYNLLEPQKLYNSARNIEVASWLIRTKYNKDGELFLLSTAEENNLNLSFERLFGKLINAQDMMAQIVANTTHREIKNVVQSLAAVFIPI
ncbi:MAG: hypothetical protein ACU85E_11845 [Gammaproteobacteria bacterium]